MHPFNWFIRTCIFLLIVLCEYSIIACDSWSADSQSLKNLRESLRIFGEVIVEVGEGSWFRMLMGFFETLFR